VEKTIRSALDEYKKICAELVPEAELKRVKDHLRGTTLIGLEQSNAVANFIGSEEMVTGHSMTVDEVFAKIDSVTSADVMVVAREIIRAQHLNLAMIGPFKDRALFESLLKEF